MVIPTFPNNKNGGEEYKRGTFSGKLVTVKGEVINDIGDKVAAELTTVA